MMINNINENISKRQKSEKKILTAAIKVIANQGFHDTRITDIAREANVAYGLVYHYFGSKNNIINVILEQVTKKFSEKIEKVDAEEIHTIEKLCKISDYMFDTYLASKEIIQVLINEVIKDHTIHKNKLIATRILDKITNIIEKGKKKKHIPVNIESKILTLIFFGSIQMLLTSLVTNYYEIQDQNKSAYIKKFKKQIRSLFIKDTNNNLKNLSFLSEETT